MCTDLTSDAAWALTRNPVYKNSEFAKDIGMQVEANEIEMAWDDRKSKRPGRLLPHMF